IALSTARIHRVRGRPPLLAAGINSLIHSHSSLVRSLGYIFSFIHLFYTTHEDFSDRLLELGAEITVLHGYHFQTTGDLLLASYVSGLVQERQKYGDKTLQNDLLKLTINSFYGKQGQGLHDKFKYDIDERQRGADQPSIPPCDITLPHMAAMTTGLSRTVLCVLVLELSQTPGC